VAANAVPLVTNILTLVTLLFILAPCL
jgi:hypothetical protein